MKKIPKIEKPKDEGNFLVQKLGQWVSWLNISSLCENIWHNILVLLNIWVYGNWRRHTT